MWLTIAWLAILILALLIGFGAGYLFCKDRYECYVQKLNKTRRKD